MRYEVRTSPHTKTEGFFIFGRFGTTEHTEEIIPQPSRSTYYGTVQPYRKFGIPKNRHKSVAARLVIGSVRQFGNFWPALPKGRPNQLCYLLANMAQSSSDFRFRLNPLTSHFLLFRVRISSSRLLVVVLVDVFP
jgi:hypothetical protein